MMGINHDFLAGNFMGYPLEENRFTSYKDFNYSKKRVNPLENLNNIFNNSGDYLIELNELREYKRLATQKIKKYESCVYSYKNQIRNLKGPAINLQLINVFVNAICDIVEHLCADINKPVLSALPLIHTILNSTPVVRKNK
ncbi:conserved Plasmodium protein, unknown function, partial [Plasmodium malariae]